MNHLQPYIPLSVSFQKELSEIAIQLKACVDYKRDVSKIKSFGQLLIFLEKNTDVVDERYFEWLEDKEKELESKFLGPTTPAENVIEWLNSPFVSDYDKERVREYIFKQKKSA